MKKNSKVAIPYKVIDMLWNDEEFYSKTLSKSKVFIEKFPRFDQWCDDAGLHMAFALAGFSSEDISVLVYDNIVTVKSSSKDEVPKDNSMQHGIIFRGIARRKFSSSFKINSMYSAKNANCIMKNGLLEITIPKRESLKELKLKIEV